MTIPTAHASVTYAPTAKPCLKISNATLNPSSPAVAVIFTKTFATQRIGVTPVKKPQPRLFICWKLTSTVIPAMIGINQTSQTGSESGPNLLISAPSFATWYPEMPMPFKPIHGIKKAANMTHAQIRTPWDGPTCLPACVEGSCLVLNVSHELQLLPSFDTNTLPQRAQIAIGSAAWPQCFDNEKPKGLHSSLRCCARSAHRWEMATFARPYSVGGY